MIKCSAKRWLTLLIHYQASTAAALTLGNGKVISVNNVWWMYLSILGLHLIHFNVTAPNRARYKSLIRQVFVISLLIVNDFVSAMWTRQYHLNITVTLQRARYGLKTPASPLFTQPFIQAQTKENIKVPSHWPSWGEFTGGRWIPDTKGQ